MYHKLKFVKKKEWKKKTKERENLGIGGLLEERYV